MSKLFAAKLKNISVNANNFAECFATFRHPRTSCATLVCTWLQKNATKYN